MAVGIITNPLTWLLRSPVGPAWLQNVQDNVNYVFGTRYLWLGVPSLVPDTGWTIGGGGQYWVSANAGDNLLAPLDLYYTASGNFTTTKRLKPSSFAFRLKPAGASAVTCLEVHMNNMSTTSTPAGTSGASGTSSGTAEQTVTVAVGSTVYTNDDQVMSLKVTAGQTGDRFYGVRVTYALNG
jgi:hypothetical protein